MVYLLMIHHFYILSLLVYHLCKGGIKIEIQFYFVDVSLYVSFSSTDCINFSSTRGLKAALRPDRTLSLAAPQPSPT